MAWRNSNLYSVAPLIIQWPIFLFFMCLSAQATVTSSERSKLTKCESWLQGANIHVTIQIQILVHTYERAIGYQ